MRHMEKGTIMLVGYPEVPRAPVSLAHKSQEACAYTPNGVASMHQLPQDALAEKLTSPNQKQDASTRSVRRNVPDFKLLDAPRSTTIASSALRPPTEPLNIRVWT